MTLFKPAVRERIKLRAAIDGPTGSGKTWTALQWARILAGREGSIGVIDTESGGKGALRYVAPPGGAINTRLAAVRVNWFDPPYEFGHLPAKPPYDPRDLAKLIEVAGDELGEDGVLVIDSLTHFWNGEGGTLDIVDDAATRTGSSFTAWKEGTPAQRYMLDHILTARCHVLVTMRSKMEYAIEDYTDSKGNKKSKPVRMGLQPEQRPGIEYEFDVVASMDRDHRLVITKSRLPDLADKVAQKGRSHEVAQTMGEWLATGAVPIDSAQADALVEAMNSVSDLDTRKALKNDFLFEWGDPHELIEANGEPAAAWVWDRLKALGVVEEEPQPSKRRTKKAAAKETPAAAALADEVTK